MDVHGWGGPEWASAFVAGLGFILGLINLRQARRLREKDRQFAQGMVGQQAELDRVTDSLQIQASALAARRLQVLEEVYDKLAVAHEAFMALTDPFEKSGTPSLIDRMEAALAAHDAYHHVAIRARIFVPETTADLFIGLRIKLSRVWRDFTETPPELRKGQAFREMWLKSWEAVNGDVGKIRDEIERQARHLLGVELAAASDPPGTDASP